MENVIPIILDVTFHPECDKSERIELCITSGIYGEESWMYYGEVVYSITGDSIHDVCSKLMNFDLVTMQDKKVYVGTNTYDTALADELRSNFGITVVQFNGNANDTIDISISVNFKNAQDHCAIEIEDSLTKKEILIRTDVIGAKISDGMQRMIIEHF